MQNQYQDEAKQRWGNTSAYKQSVERTKNWTKADYKRIETETKILTQKLADTMDKGSESPEFQALVDEHYQSMCLFYDCSLEMYRNLGEMYVNDPRFTAHYDKFKPGLAQCLRDAINIYVKTGKQ